MFKTLTLFCFALATLTCYAQKTQTPITGIDAIKLGDSISRVNKYGFPFIAVTKYRLSDSIIAKLKVEKMKIYEYSDSGRTFCPDVSVFITNNFNINQIQHSKTATLALTYFKNVLIEIRIIDSAKRIRANYIYGLKKYGKGFAEEWDGYTTRQIASNRDINPNAKMPPPPNLSKVPIDSIAKDLSETHRIESIYWVNGNYSFSYNTCSQPLDYWTEKFVHHQDHHAADTCAEEAIIIKNDKAYKAMTACSDKALKQLSSKYTSN
jgi:hypothetical protein